MKSARILVAAALACAGASGVLAQSKDDITNKITTMLPDNGRGGITAAGLRGVMNSLNGARGAPNGIAELGPDGKLLPAQGQTSFTTGNFAGDVTASSFAAPGSGSFGSMQMKQLPPVDLSLAGTKNPNAIMAGPGNAISFCPTRSCIFGPNDGSNSVNPLFFDHQRASFLVSGSTQLDGVAQEQTLGVTTTIATGFAKPYAPNTAYALGDNVVVGGGFGGAVYRAIQAGTTGSNSMPQSSRPSVAQGGNNYTVMDGTVRWKWINDSAIGAKVGIYNETEVMPGAGSAWGMANNTEIAPGSIRAGHATFGFENDFSNNSGIDCALGVPCDAIRVGVGGPSKSTSGINIDTNNGNGAAAPQNFAMLWGIRFSGPKLASEASIALDANGKYGIAANQLGLGGDTFTGSLIYDNSSSPSSLRVTGPKSSAVIDDASNAPTGLLVGGTKSISALQVGSTSPIGINLVGNYSGAQVQGAGWSVAPNGFLTVPRLREASPRTIASPTEACFQGERAWDANFEYRCVDTNSWQRSSRSGW